MVPASRIVARLCGLVQAAGLSMCLVTIDCRAPESPTASIEAYILRSVDGLNLPAALCRAGGVCGPTVLFGSFAFVSDTTVAYVERLRTAAGQDSNVAATLAGFRTPRIVVITWPGPLQSADTGFRAAGTMTLRAWRGGQRYEFLYDRQPSP